MKIRVMGTMPECQMAKDYYSSLRGQESVKSVSVSEFYPNRGSMEIYRVYIEIEYYEVAEPVVGNKKRLRGETS